MTQQIATVTFHGTPLTVITHDDQQLVAMKPIVEAIGLQWEAQYKRIQRHPVLKAAMSIMDIPSAGGVQRTACLPLDYLNGWLFGVDANRVREEIRDTLIQYQRECYQVLADYWQKGEAKMPTRKRQPKALSNGLSLNQQEAIKAMVKGRAETLPQNKQAGATIKLWSALKTKFGCSYKEIHPDFYTDAVSLVARLPLEGEYIEREPDAFASDSYRADAAKFALDYVQRLHRHIDDPANNPKPVYDKAEESRLAAGMAAGMLHSSRMLVTYGWDGKQHITPVPEGAAVMTPSQMLQYLAGPERFAVDADELLQFIQAATDRLQRMHTYQRTLLAS